MTADDPMEASERRAWMGLCARAPAARLCELVAAMGPPEPVEWLRRPETGTVMIRARAGGTGAPFHLGEMTATRGTLRLSCGTVGHGWVQGRDRAACEAAARVDAAMQTPRAGAVRRAVLDPLAAEEEARRRARAGRAAATRVEFFTLARGEDE
ncbi:phosphonate C-P lyase system protein PhnG [Rubellimicrobium sp. CFH 75288]|uniref:phosphonate C-P lyase system protein PhnG n=1 Tax=Rubellimicrobium sp. CFH 75288 TaxID=2697034 RepID=UPI001FB57130|nr:phosphonate C-P lyase system protein PhnG [Rubellimicrobium sp. CFH 75288]